MACDRSIFKAYDIRGTYPDQLDEIGAYAIGRAYVEFLGASTLAVGRDMRTMAPSITRALIRGIVDAGARVEDIGLVGTEVLYHWVASRGLDGGIMVTASHNPAEYIGMKCVKRGAQPVGETSGLDRVKSLALDWLDEHADATIDQTTDVGESVTSLDALDSWRARMSAFMPSTTTRDLTIVIDAGNGVGASLIVPLLEQLPHTLHVYHDEPDGTFPHHEPNPLLEENRQFIIAKVKQHNADLGIAFDGDADRCFFVDNEGEFVPGDFVTALLAQVMLAKDPKETVLYDVRASRAVADTVTKLGGTAIASRVGHAFIKQRMKVEGALFAGEISGHYYFRDYYGVDTGVIPALIMVGLIGSSDESLAQRVGNLRSTYHLSGEINSRVRDVPLRLQQIKETYIDAHIHHLDGISVEYEDWHFNVRSSNTEPLLRLNLESLVSTEHMEVKRDEVLELIRSDSRARIGHHTAGNG